MRAGAPIAAVAATLWAVAAAQAGDYLDTTITFVASDDNVLAGAGETIPSSPNADFRPRTANSLFFDNYNSRNTGEETRTHLVLHKAFEGHFARVTPEAALVIEWDANRTARDADAFLETGSQRVPGGIRDDGSYLAIHWDLRPATEAEPAEQLSLVAFPFDSDRFRLGYSWELTWGGRKAFILARNVPAVKLAWTGGWGYAFLGLKTARTQRFTESVDPCVLLPGSPGCPTPDTDAPASDAGRNENEAVYGVLGGFGIQATKRLLLELEGGWFERGNIPIDRGTLQGTPIDQMGVSAQVTLHDGIEPRVPADTKLYRQPGPTPRPRDWTARKLAWLVSAEASLTSQILEDFEAVGTTTREYGWAGDLNGLLHTGNWAFNVDIVGRSMEFLVQDTPGLFPFSTIPEAVDATPEIFAAVGADYHYAPWRLVPGISLGVQRPASASVDTVDQNGNPQSQHTLVRRTKNVLGQTNTQPTPLPPGVEVAPVFSARGRLRSELSDILSLTAEVQLTFDENLVSNDPTEGFRTFDNPLVLGLGLIAQARF